ncbi:MAG TPA: GNAT family N-acetyltransferase [Vicinamibacterales bacterium]|nr:GNAT family N-acetyltransferase [Vicinamibacterales bacterium]
MIFKPLTTDDDLTNAFPLMSALRDRIRADTFVAEVRRQQQDGYELIGGFDDGRLVTLAGIRRSHTLSRGEHLFVDDLVTDESARGQGYGRQMIAWLVERARGEGIPRIYLDSRNTARGFYERVGFTFQTSIPCWLDVSR